MRKFVYAEHTRKRFYRMLSILGTRFHRMLSILGTNFRACSASCKKNVNIFTCTIHAEHTRNEFYCTLSLRGTNSIAC
jgi:hypothetical protein